VSACGSGDPLAQGGVGAHHERWAGQIDGQGEELIAVGVPLMAACELICPAECGWGCSS